MAVQQNSSVLSNLVARSQNQTRTNGRQGQSREDLPKAQMWMNIGFVAGDGRFVNLPYGLPIDTMQKARVAGSDEEFIALRHAQNELLAAVQAEGDKLEPGQEIEIPLLTVRLRRVKDELEIDPETNPSGKQPNGLNLGIRLVEPIKKDEK